MHWQDIQLLQFWQLGNMHKQFGRTFMVESAIPKAIDYVSIICTEENSTLKIELYVTLAILFREVLVGGTGN